MISRQSLGTAESGIFLEIINVVKRMPKALSWQPACQIRLSAFQVSADTVAARVGTRRYCRRRGAAFCDGHGCRSAIRVQACGIQQESADSWHIAFALHRSLNAVLDVALSALHHFAFELIKALAVNTQITAR